MDEIYKICNLCGVVLKAEMSKCANCNSTSLQEISPKKLEVLSKKVVENEEKEAVLDKN